MPLSFRSPQNLGASLMQVYEHLSETLSRLVGYPIYVRSDSKRPTRYCEKTEGGRLRYQLPATSKATPRGYLELHESGTEDRFACVVTDRFMRGAKRLLSECKNSWDVKATLIRNETAFWDEIAVTAASAYRGNQKYIVLDALWTLRTALHFRYEQTQPPVAVLLSWSYHNLRKVPGFRTLNLKKRIPLGILLREWKGAHLVSDGKSAAFLLSPRGTVDRLILNPGTRLPVRESDFVSPQYTWLTALLEGRSIAVLNSGPGEQLVISKHTALKWRTGEWSRLWHTRVVDLIQAATDPGVSSLVVTVVRSLSARKKGALILLPFDENSLDKLLTQLSGGVRDRFKGPHLFKLSLETVSFFERLCEIDGATVVDRAGNVINAGAIVQLSDDQSQQHEGARTAAARAASLFCISIKVSEDGPITVWDHGVALANVN